MAKQETSKLNWVTLSVIKADIGGWVGHSAIHPDLVESATEDLAAAKKSGSVLDFNVTACGDDLQLIFTHRHGVDHEKCTGWLGRSSPKARRLRRASTSMVRARTCSPMPSAAM